MKTFICKIEYCEARHVHVVPNFARQKVYIMDFVPWAQIPTLDFSSMECSNSHQGETIYDTHVRATLAERIILPRKPLVFRLTDLYGKKYLLGLPDLVPPAPMVTQEDKAGAKPSEVGLCQFDIRLKSTYPLLAICYENI